MITFTQSQTEMEKDKIQELSSFATQIRRDIVRMVNAQNSGHPGGSLGCVEYFTVLL
jgi:transketolase